jgi:hypothetical protein
MQRIGRCFFGVRRGNAANPSHLQLTAVSVVHLLCSCAGEISAVEALRQACQSLKQVCAHMKEKFTEACNQYEEREGNDKEMQGS